MPALTVLWSVNNMIAPVILALVLRSATARWVHYAGLMVLLAGLAWHYAPYQIN
jgi:hypothetical protein